jgi:hypothetical protein
MPQTLPGGLVVYTCGDWGARPPLHTFGPTQPSDLVLHHMDYPNRAPLADHSAAVQKAFQIGRICQNDHMDRNGWADTGQHFTVSIDGVCLEGRHGSLAALLAGQCIRGAHAADADTGADDNDSWGTEHEGTYSTAPMPMAQWNASVQLQAAIAFLCKLDATLLKGHRDTGCNTLCCGDWLQAQLDRFRSDTHTAKAKLLQW